MIHIMLLSFIFVFYCCIGVGLGFILKDLFHVDSRLIKILAVFFWPAILIVGFVYGIINLIKYILD